MITGSNQTLIEAYNLLFSFFGPQNWWPAETELEMMVGAILTQNTNWNNVEKAILNLKEKSLLSIPKLSQISASTLADFIRPAGYYNLKAKRLKNLINFIVDRYNGNINSLFSLNTDTIREELLTVKGIGLETADSIVLYGAGRPIFVVDTYTHRIVTRHGLIEEEAGYHDLQSFFMDNLTHDAELFKEFHALIVKTGKNFCKRDPLCPECPLNQLNKEASMNFRYKEL
jgi:endonuclease-3 related protein